MSSNNQFKFETLQKLNINMRIKRHIILVLFFLAQISLSAPHCLNEKGEYVSYFMAIRFNPSVHPRDYIILDSKSKVWRKVNEKDFLPKIFGQVNLKEDTVTAWNDEPPSGRLVGTSYAHSKGLIALSSSGKKGFFLSHSIPKFPNIANGVIDPVSNPDSKYGQHILCVSISSKKSYDDILDQMDKSNPYIYYGYRPNKVLRLFSKAEENAISMNVNEFTYVTKPKSLEVEVYEDFFIPFWDTGFMVETWGRPLKPSICGSKRPIVNILKVGFEDLEQTESRDHSKWSISYDEEKGLVCLGDLNHQDSQSKRGGSFLCLEDKEIHGQFRSLVKEDECGVILKGQRSNIVEEEE